VVERLLHTQEVAGSNPASRTSKISHGSASLLARLTAGLIGIGEARTATGSYTPKTNLLGSVKNAQEFRWYGARQDKVFLRVADK
jgi:hypothetical protein